MARVANHDDQDDRSLGRFCSSNAPSSRSDIGLLYMANGFASANPAEAFFANFDIPDFLAGDEDANAE